jgi:hypothetical protein
LVDIGATHNIVSEWNATTLHHNFERSMATFKVVNLVVKPTTKSFCFVTLKVGEWFGSLDLTIAPLDDHIIILRKVFLKISKAVPMPNENCLMFLDGTKTYGVPMMNRRNLGRMPRIQISKLTEETSESMVRNYVIAQQQEELVMEKATLYDKYDEYHTNSMMTTLETSMESVLNKTKLLCTLKKMK